ncbi:MAG TPA: YncE family protein [Gaiellaceae bacterium]|nr:YncE family protein [Gaiellaceae bacterium]
MRLLLVVCMLAAALVTGPADAAGRSQVTTIVAGAGPSVVAVDSSRNLVFVTSVRSNTLSVLDGSTQAVISTITRPPGGKGVALAVDPVAGRLYDLDGALDQVLVWDETTHALVARWQAPAVPSGVAVDPAAGRVYVTSAVGGVGYFTSLNESTGAKVTQRQVGTDPRGVAVDPTTGQAWVADAATQVVYVVDPASGLEANFFPIAGGAFGVAIDPRLDGTRVWVAGGRGVSVILPARNIIAGTAATGGTASSVAVDPATGFAYAVTPGASTAKGTLAVLEQTLQAAPAIDERVVVGVLPLGVSVDLYNARVFVANAGADPDAGSVSAVSEFQPLAHGFHFANNFKGRLGGFDLAATPFGLSGGMVYAALDTFNVGWGAPPDTKPPAAGSVREYISKREVEGLGAQNSAVVKQFHLWQGYPSSGPTGLPQRSLRQFQSVLRPSLDRGVPMPVGVVRAQAGRPVWENREVLATGYFRNGSQWVLELYDPAAPDRTVYVNTSTLRETVRANGTGLIGKAWRGFFAITSYARSTPPWAPRPPSG